MNRYAISDIHGCAKTFRHLVEEQIKLKPTDQLYLLGDYLDRGPDSKGVIDYVLDLKEKGYQVQTLKGNHEDLMLQALEDEEYLENWLLNGGKTALASFGVSSVAEVPTKYWDFLHGLPNYLEVEGYYLVHAGFNFEEPDFFSDTEAMLWIRDFEVFAEDLKGRKIVHGHTPIRLDQIIDKVFSEKTLAYNIDGGCVFKGEYGQLVALDLDQLEIYFSPNLD